MYCDQALRGRAGLTDRLHPFELIAADTSDPRDKLALEAFKVQVGGSKEIICFSNDWNNPLPWGCYAKAHTGMALGFESTSNKYSRKV